MTLERTTPAAAGMDADRLGRIAYWMQGYVDGRKHPGNSAVIARGGKIVWEHATGLSDIENGKPFTSDTIARIYSMTKPITSVALMMLVERGLTQLDAPLSDILPEFADCHALVPGATRIDQVERCFTPRLHQLFTHTAGFSYPFNPGVLAGAMNEAGLVFRGDRGTLAKATRDVAQLPLAFVPGTAWEYSVSIDILGRVVEVLSGKTLDQVFADEIFTPLGMTDTAFNVSSDRLDRFAALYSPLDDDPMAINSMSMGDNPLRLVDTGDSNSPFTRVTSFSGGGGLTGTIGDYLRFCEMLRQGGALEGERLLSPSTIGFMRQNHLPGGVDIASMGPNSFAEMPMEGMGFGLGGAVLLDTGRNHVPGNVGDFSWGGMASTMFWIDPVADLSVVFFTQLSPSSSYPSRPQLKALVHGALTA